jgi:hypothetical protein
MRAGRSVPRASIVAATAFLIVACVSGGGSTVAPSSRSTEDAASTAPGEPGGSEPIGSAPPPSGMPAAPPPSGVPADVWSPIVADAAARGGVDTADVRVVEASRVEWNDGSLGCPEPGMTYTQAIVSGWQVVVAVNGETIDYRVTGPGAFRICATESEVHPTF